MRIDVLAAAAALLALGGTGLVADEKRGTRRARLEAARAEIGLTDEQVSEIRRIHRETRKAAIKRNAELRIARMELDELMAAPTLDEAKIAARVKAIADLQAAALQERTNSKLAVRKLGTQKGRIGFVSSNCWDAMGAKSYGFRVYWINRAGAPVDRLGFRPDAILGSLDEVMQ